MNAGELALLGAAGIVAGEFTGVTNLSGGGDGEGGGGPSLPSPPGLEFGGISIDVPEPAGVGGGVEALGDAIGKMAESQSDLQDEITDRAEDSFALDTQSIGTDLGDWVDEQTDKADPTSEIREGIPSDAGDAGEILGGGSWNLLAGFDRGFAEASPFDGVGSNIDTIFTQNRKGLRQWKSIASKPPLSGMGAGATLAGPGSGDNGIIRPKQVGTESEMAGKVRERVKSATGGSSGRLTSGTGKSTSPSSTSQRDEEEPILTGGTSGGVLTR